MDTRIFSRRMSNLFSVSLTLNAGRYGKDTELRGKAPWQALKCLHEDMQSLHRITTSNESKPERLRRLVDLARLLQLCTIIDTLTTYQDLVRRDAISKQCVIKPAAQSDNPIRRRKHAQQVVPMIRSEAFSA